MKSTPSLSAVKGRLVVVAVLAWVFPSCQSLDPGDEKPDLPTSEVTEEAKLPAPEEAVPAVSVPIGKIMGVGNGGRFVVISLDPGASVATGDKLTARFAGAQTAVLKVSPERQGNLVTADVVAGNPARDHEIVK